MSEAAENSNEIDNQTAGDGEQIEAQQDDQLEQEQKEIENSDEGSDEEYGDADADVNEPMNQEIDGSQEEDSGENPAEVIAQFSSSNFNEDSDGKLFSRYHQIISVKLFSYRF